jgi:hypothetical protein
MPVRTTALILLASLLSPAARADEAQRLADGIDARVKEKWKTSGTEAAGTCDDATYLRRIYLDITGTIPPASEVQTFLADTSTDKRTRAVERLLKGPGYVRHFAAAWQSLLLGEGRAEADFEDWLRLQFADNLPYDRLMSAILKQPAEPAKRGEPSPRAFFRGREGKPDEIAASVTRLFLGVRLECAQCHDHPFAGWKREQFWSQAAFFTREGRPSLEIPNGGKVVEARFLDGSPLAAGKQIPRLAFADWTVTKENPYFARAAVNRLWAHFLGIGLVDPVDDFNDTNPPSHPMLLDELTRAFVDQKFDLKLLMKAIVLSRTYQLESSGGVAKSPPLFERRAVRLLEPEQILGSLVQATGHRPTERERGVFLARFTRTESRVDAPTGIPQALALMNGSLVRAMTDPKKSPTLIAVGEAPFLDVEGKVKSLFLATLSRQPTAAEAKRFNAHVARGDESGDVKQALSDVLWALLNSAEFVHYH